MNKCGDNNNCKQLAEILHLVIDNQATPDQENFFNQHIHDCAPCLDHYEIDKSLQAIIKERLLKKECCSSLLDSIRTQIKNIQA